MDAGINVAVHAPEAERVELCLFDKTGGETRYALPERTGGVWHGVVPGVTEGALYGLRAHGPWAPHAGHRFNAAKLLIDPYALELDRVPRLHPTMFGHSTDDPLARDDADSAAAMPKGIVMRRPPTPPIGRPDVPWSGTIIYELHVRGFSMRHPDIPPAIRGTFAALAHPAAIAHLTALGVTTVEIMPSAAWIEERHLARLGLTNYWGYNPVALLAPDKRLAPGGWAEVRGAVAALAQAGIETILDAVLNHTGEGDEFGPTVSLRGLDNAGYYRLRNNDRALYVDDTGCGHALACDRLPVVRLAADALRCWAELGGVHGFRFDLGTTLGRRDDGFDPAAPLLSAIAQDPVLRELKIIAEPWDVGQGGYRLGAFPAQWGEWNDRYRDDVRRFWRGDPGMLGSVATRIAGSADVLGCTRRPSRSINFVTAHDGFTLADLVSYEQRRNEANGEHGRDGAADNHSWNNGAEGATDDPAILAARHGDQLALLATLLFSRGTPMLAMGAELGHSQQGNNNAYCQDSPLSWIDWDHADRELAAAAAQLVRARLDHPALHDDRFLTGKSDAAPEPPDVAWLARRRRGPRSGRLEPAAGRDAGSRLYSAHGPRGRGSASRAPADRRHAACAAARPALVGGVRHKRTGGGSCPLRHAVRRERGRGIAAASRHSATTSSTAPRCTTRSSAPASNGWNNHSSDAEADATASPPRPATSPGRSGRAHHSSTANGTPSRTENSRMNGRQAVIASCQPACRAIATAVARRQPRPPAASQSTAAGKGSHAQRRDRPGTLTRHAANAARTAVETEPTTESHISGKAPIRPATAGRSARAARAAATAATKASQPQARIPGEGSRSTGRRPPDSSSISRSVVSVMGPPPGSPAAT